MIFAAHSDQMGTKFALIRLNMRLFSENSSMNFEFVDPFQRLEEFRRQANESLDELLAEMRNSGQVDESISFQPDADLVETANEFRFYLSIPGLVEDDIVINVDDQRLTIRGERRPPYDTDCRRTSRI